MANSLHLTSNDLHLFQAARQNSRPFIREVERVPVMLESCSKASTVDALLKCASEHFGIQPSSKRRDPLFELLKSRGIHAFTDGFATRYYFSTHDDPKRIVVLTDAEDRREQIHFEIVLSAVKKFKGGPQPDMAGSPEMVPVLTVNVLSS